MSSIEECILAGTDYRLDQVYTSIPCLVINVRNIKEQRIDVQPIVNRKTPDGSYKEQPTILSVPLVFPSSSTSAFTFKINVGDTVLCTFSQRCIDAFKAGDGSPAKPLDLRKFDKRDAVAIPGLFPFSKAINNPSKRKWTHDTNDTVLVHNIGKSNETEIRFKDDGSLVINSTNEFTVNCSKATVNAPSVVNGTATINGNATVNGNIHATGTITGDTDVVAGTVSLKTHTHIGSPTAPVGAISPTGIPIP